MRLLRHWAMPNADTFSIPVFGELVERCLRGTKSSADPFARRTRLATHRNDLDPACEQPFVLDSREFARELGRLGIHLDAILFDPPYSPRQIAECYRSVGLSVGMEETQSARLYSETRDLLDAIADVGCVAVSFGWNSVGFGKERGWDLEEVHLVCHGGAHNDTIAVVERKVRAQVPMFAGF